MADLLIRMLIYLPERAKKALGRSAACIGIFYRQRYDADRSQRNRNAAMPLRSREESPAGIVGRLDADQTRPRINALKREAPVSTTSSKSCTHTRGKSATHSQAFAAAIAASVTMSHPQAAGAAAAVLGFVQMCAAGTVALLQGVIYDGTVFPIAGMQLLLAVLAFVIWHRLKQYSLPPSAAA